MFFWKRNIGRPCGAHSQFLFTSREKNSHITQGRDLASHLSFGCPESTAKSLSSWLSLSSLWGPSLLSSVTQGWPWSYREDPCPGVLGWDESQGWQLRGSAGDHPRSHWEVGVSVLLKPQSTILTLCPAEGDLCVTSFQLLLFCFVSVSQALRCFPT